MSLRFVVGVLSFKSGKQLINQISIDKQAASIKSQYKINKPAFSFASQDESRPRKRGRFGTLHLCASLLFLLSAQQPSYAGLQSDLDAIIEAPSTPAALWGIHIVERDSGDVLYTRNGATPFVPASVVKLVTTAVALDRLGPDYTFSTHLQFPAQQLPADGVLHGDLQLIGGGDPTLGTPEGAVGRAVFDRWAKRLKKEGVKRIEGNIVGIDDLFVEEPLSEGWAWDDENYAFSAQSSGLTTHGGVSGYRIEKNRRQRLNKSQIHLYPRSSYLKPEVALTGEQNRVAVGRERGTNNFVVTVPKKMRRNPEMSGKVTVDNPTAYAATLFMEAVARAGIEVAGKALDSDTINGYQQQKGLVWSHHSNPLSEILPLANKRSINLVAEHLLRTLGVKRNRAGEVVRQGSVDRGLEVVDRFLKELKIKPYRYHLVDGSGLSRYNLLRPEDLVKVLDAMERHPNARVFRSSLSRAGHDGTLRYRFHETPLQGKVWAKTGTLSGIRAVAGHLKTPKGRELTFAVLVNNYASGKRKIRNRIDSLLIKAAEWADRER